MSIENAHKTVMIAIDSYRAAVENAVAKDTPPCIVLPIEQAPLDPTAEYILMRRETYPFDSDWEWATLGRWQPDSDEGGYWETSDSTLFIDVQPTHFMYKPAIPA